MSPGETIHMLDAHARRQKHETEKEKANLKGRATLAYALAGLIGSLFTRRGLPKIEEAFPDLFKDEKEEEAPRWKREQAGFSAFVAAMNDKIRQQRGETR